MLQGVGWAILAHYLWRAILPSLPHSNTDVGMVCWVQFVRKKPPAQLLPVRPGLFLETVSKVQ